MKAEHRKELETNALANRMGSALQTLRKKPDRRGWLYLVAGIVVVLIASVVYLNYQNNKSVSSENWYQLEDGALRHLVNLSSKESETNAGKAARMQLAWIETWEQGIKQVGQQPKKALDLLSRKAEEYAVLRREMEGDPVFEPEALYALAAIDETFAIVDRNRIDSALRKYEQLAKDHPKSAFGKLAAERADLLNDATKRAEIDRVYQDMQIMLRIQDNLERARGKGLPGLPKGK